MHFGKELVYFANNIVHMWVSYQCMLGVSVQIQTHKLLYWFSGGQTQSHSRWTKWMKLHGVYVNSSIMQKNYTKNKYPYLN